MMRIFFLLLVPLLLFGIDAKVSLTIAPNQEFFVSKKIVATLKVMSTGFKMDNLNVDFGNNDNFIIIAPQSAAYNDYEDGYSVVVYEFVLYPLTSKKVWLEPWNISFDISMGYGMPKKHFQKTTQRKKLFIDAPQGYDFILATSDLQAQNNYELPDKALEVGDIITRTTVVQATSIPDVLLPAIPLQRSKAFEIRQDEPKIYEKKQGAQTIAVREQTEYFILKQDGNLTIEALRFDWFDTTTHKVRHTTTQPLHITVKPLPQEESVSRKEAKMGYIWFFIGGVLALGLFFVFKQVPSRHLVNSINPE